MALIHGGLLFVILPSSQETRFEHLTSSQRRSEQELVGGANHETDNMCCSFSRVSLLLKLPADKS